MHDPVLTTTVTCPSCKHRFSADMPTDACVQQIPCPSCKHILGRVPPDCCVFCSHADHRCPPEQEDAAAIREHPIFRAWAQMRGNMPYETLRFARFAFDEIAAGRNVTIQQAAEQVGVSRKQADEHVARTRRWGLMSTDEDEITGALGLTTQPSQYAVQLNGRDLHVWCALDAVGIPAALGADARVRVEGVADIEIANGKLVEAEPAQLRISVNDPYLAEDIKSNICPTISFHHGAGPDHESMAWLTVAEAMELGRVIWAVPTPDNSRTEEVAA